MSIGETLAQARHESGLSVADVSHQTRIRETIISGIERDDFAPCGGDFYARGHIRAIARAVGVDSAPLIEEYDTVHLEPGVIPTGHRPPEAVPEEYEEEDAGEPVTPVVPWQSVPPDHPVRPHQQVTPAEWMPEPEPADTPYQPVTPPGPVRAETWTAPASSATPDTPAAPPQPDTPPQPVPPGGGAPPGDGAPLSDPISLGDPIPLGGPETPSDPTPLGDRTAQHGAPRWGDRTAPHGGPAVGDSPPRDAPSMYREPSTYGAPSAHRRRRMNWSAVLGLALLVVVGLGAYLLASGGNSRQARSAAAAHGATSHPSSHPTPTASRATSPAPTPSATPAQPLTPANITAFGPSGPGQGDNPQLAQYALNDNAASPWHSDWYTTPQFGNLQPGTGLLLDMGHTVNITAAQVAVGNVTGADIQLRVGSTPALSGLPPVARASDVGGTARMHLTTPSQGRYVLVWFTKLPSDPAGTFQASVYSIKLQGNG